MHQYLRSIGFSGQIRRKLIHSIIQRGISDSSTCRAYTANDDEDGSLFAQYSVELGDGFGIIVAGQFDADDVFYPEYYFPYLSPENVSSMEEISIEKRVDLEAYDAIINDYRISAVLCFRVQNYVEMIKNDRISIAPLEGATASISGLSLGGTIIMPIYRTQEDIDAKKEEMNKIYKLNYDVRNGDDDALAKLVDLESLEYVHCLQRLRTEDLYTVIETQFRPVNAESEVYYVLGNIQKIRNSENKITGDKVTVMTLETCGITIDVIINNIDLLGEPKVGRRFKGKIWLQGVINYSNII